MPPKLRSKEPDKTLFRFDDANALIYQHQPIAMAKGTDFHNLYRWFNETLPERTNTSKTTNLVTSYELLPRRVREDPLPDEHYEVFHKKMKREERAMTNSDRLKIMLEIDNLRQQLHHLHQYDWARHLPKITHINNVLDLDEMTHKKQLTEDEIARLLDKYDDWRRRQEVLLADMKAHASSIEETESMLTTDLAVLQENRRQERIRRDGPKITLRLGNGYDIVASPYERPHVRHRS